MSKPDIVHELIERAAPSGALVGTSSVTTSAWMTTVDWAKLVCLDIVQCARDSSSYCVPDLDNWRPQSKRNADQQHSPRGFFWTSAQSSYGLVVPLRTAPQYLARRASESEF